MRFPRFVWLIALALGMGRCTDLQSLGQRCSFNDDCAEPLICAAAACRSQCRTSRDCPPMFRCVSSNDPMRSVCAPESSDLPCATEANCPENARCSPREGGAVCRVRCALDSTCGSLREGSVCNESEALCSLPLLVSQWPSTGSGGGDAGADATGPTDVPGDAVSPDASAADASAEAGPDAAAPDAAAPDAPAPDAPAPDAPAPDAPGPDAPGLDAPGLDAPAADAPAPDAPRLDAPAADAADASADAVTDRPTAVDVTCSPGRANCDGDPGNGCEVTLATDGQHCGSCGSRCPAMANMAPVCSAGRCGTPVCAPGFSDCDGVADNGCEQETTSVDRCGGCMTACPAVTALNSERACVRNTATNRYECRAACVPNFGDCTAALGCETDLRTTPNHCGACNNVCPDGTGCAGGRCVGSSLTSTGADGPFDPDRGLFGRTVSPPTGDAGSDAGADLREVWLEPGRHDFTTIHVPPGLRVRVATQGVLDLRATGDVTIEGIIDLSGGRGGNGGRASPSTCGGNGGGGQTGTAIAGETGAPGVCPRSAAGGLSSGPQAGRSGGNGGGSGCSAGGALGGGSGGSPTTAGSGGGGYAGGGGGASAVEGAPGGDGASRVGLSVGGAGGVLPSRIGLGAEPGIREVALREYAGDSAAPPVNTYLGGGGGGGSIGRDAFSDLAVRDTFRPGSGGGGGAGAYDPCTATASAGGGGGGGGGGALRIASATRIQMSGSARLYAMGGNGAPGVTLGVAGSSSGGGGSGGVIYLSAPRMNLAGLISAAGGAGGSGAISPAGGAGGLGRIRLSVRTDQCINSSIMVPAMTDPCQPSETPGRPVLASFPN